MRKFWRHAWHWRQAVAGAVAPSRGMSLVCPSQAPKYHEFQRENPAFLGTTPAKFELWTPVPQIPSESHCLAVRQIDNEPEARNPACRFTILTRRFAPSLMRFGSETNGLCWWMMVDKIILLRSYSWFLVIAHGGPKQQMVLPRFIQLTLHCSNWG